MGTSDYLWLTRTSELPKQSASKVTKCVVTRLATWCCLRIGAIRFVMCDLHYWLTGNHSDNITTSENRVYVLLRAEVSPTHRITFSPKPNVYFLSKHIEVFFHSRYEGIIDVRPIQVWGNSAWRLTSRIKRALQLVKYWKIMWHQKWDWPLLIAPTIKQQYDKMNQSIFSKSLDSCRVEGVCPSRTCLMKLGRTIVCDDQVDDTLPMARGTWDWHSVESSIIKQITSFRHHFISRCSKLKKSSWILYIKWVGKKLKNLSPAGKCVFIVAKRDVGTPVKQCLMIVQNSETAKHPNK